MSYTISLLEFTHTNPRRPNIDTYAGKIDDKTAGILAGYLKPILPREIAIPSLLELDRYFWTDKALRASKGNWEKRIIDHINANSDVGFRKRKFTSKGKQYELDGAYPTHGPSISIGIDVKRIESPRDIHKRADEIINKASKFKAEYKEGSFFTVVYYPFPSQHHNVVERLESTNINGLFFANETDSSIRHAAQLLLGKVGHLKPQTTL